MGLDQRRFERIPEALDVQCRPLGSRAGVWRHVAMLDISAGGIGFEATDLYDAGELVELQLVIPGLSHPVVLRGRIVRGRPKPSGVTECAVEFVDVTSVLQAEIDALVQFLKKRPS